MIESLGSKFHRRRQYTEAFQKTFRLKLKNYLDPLTGFDIVKFDEDIKTPEGRSCDEFISEKYGPDSSSIIKGLIH